jgi:HK97 family phage major capsid protein
MNAKDLRGKLETALRAASAICKTAEDAGREFSADERTQVQGYLEEAKGLKGQLRELEGDAEIRRMVAEMGGGANGSGGQASVRAGRGKTIGQRFVEAPELKAWMERVAPGGRIPDGARGLMSPPVEMPDLIALGRKALVTGDDDTSAGAFVQTDYTGIYEPLGRRPTTVLDLISMRPTQSDLVEFVRQTVQASQAAPVAEANVTNYTGATGEVEGAKPEATVAFEKVQLPVKTIAVWLPATKRGLSDAGQLRGLIDQELRDDIQEELEDQVITGDGIGENLTGVLNTAGVLTQAWDTDILRTARRAITTLRVTGRSRPTAWALHPNDWETIDLTQDAQNRYYFGGPLAMGTRTLWGVPVVECEGVTEGVGILGDWRKAVLWNRERSTIQVSDSHEDFFVRNMVAILAEMRAAFGLIRPSAFVEVDLTAGS